MVSNNIKGCVLKLNTKETSVGSLSNANSCQPELRLQESENNAWKDGGIKNNDRQNKTVHSRVKTTDPEFPKLVDLTLTLDWVILISLLFYSDRHI